MKILITLISALFQGVAAALFLIKISKDKIIISNIKKALILILSILYCFIVAMFVPNRLRILTFIFFISLLTIFVLSVKRLEAIIYAVYEEIFYIISEIIGSFILVIIGIDSSKMVTNYKYNLFANIIIALILIILICIPLTLKIFNKIKKIYNDKKKLGNGFIIMIILFILLAYKNWFEFLFKFGYYFNLLFLVIVVIVVILVLKNEYNNQKLKDENKQMLNYVTKYEKIITEQGKVNHEFKNQLMVIKGYAQMSSDKLLDYIDSITEDLKNTSSSYLISQLNKFPIGGIKGLLYYKLSVIEEEKIKYSMNVSKGIKTKLKKLNNHEIKNITKILGVLLDNAIEAAKVCKNKLIIIDVSCDKKYVVFEISNTYSGKINLNKIGAGFSTKGKGRGYGLQLVNDIIGKSDKYVLEKTFNNNYYIVRVKIKNVH